MSNYNDFGTITVICGPMRSGKSQELIRIATKYKIAGHNWVIFKPKKDTRDGAAVLSRDGSSLSENILQIETISDVVDFLSKSSKTYKFIGFDEFHFFNENFVDLFHFINTFGTDIVVCGLDMDHTGMPVRNLADIMAISNKVIKLKSICCESKEDKGIMTIMKQYSEDTRAVGGDDIYEPLSKEYWFFEMSCRDDFKKRMGVFEKNWKIEIKNGLSVTKNE